jgi:hypothetical protein
MSQRPQISEVPNSDEDSPLTDIDNDDDAESFGGIHMETEEDGLQTSSIILEPPVTVENTTIHNPIPLLQRITPVSAVALMQSHPHVEAPTRTANRSRGRNRPLQISELIDQNIAGPSNPSFNYSSNSNSNARPGRGRVQRQSPPATSVSMSISNGSSNTNNENVFDEEVRMMIGLPSLNLTNGSHDDGKPNGKADEDTKPVIDNIDDDTNKNKNIQSISEYQCPICFSPPTRACMTRCGHVMCGQCLFSAVKAAKQRHFRLYGRGPGPDGEGKLSRCPVCRAVMKGWDGKGGGVIGLKLKLPPASDISK